MAVIVPVGLMSVALLLTNRNSVKWSKYRVPLGLIAAFVIWQIIVLFVSNGLDPDRPVTGISLLLEVPLVAQEQMGFERMLAEGIAVAESMQGRIVDDNGVNLTENAVIAIRQHLDGLYSRLEQSGIAAGSATAARLFT